MTDAVNRFYNSIEDVSSLSETALVEMFVYFMTTEAGQDAATAKDVRGCFEACDLGEGKNTGALLSKGLKGKPPKYIKWQGGYKLHRHTRDQLSKKLGAEQVTVQVSATLRALEDKMVADSLDRNFLAETINCFEAGANRATIVMAWILAVDHLFEYILANKLNEFNAALASNTDKSIKISSVSERDDFSEIKETKFIELCRQAKIISNDVRKVLCQKLDIRNSSAHPSGVTVSQTKVIDFVEDLMENVVLKYPV